MENSSIEVAIEPEDAGGASGAEDETLPALEETGGLLCWDPAEVEEDEMEDEVSEEEELGAAAWLLPGTEN